MRITNQVLANNMLNNMYESLWRKADINDQLTTGKRVNKPSDDPSAMVTSLRMRTKLQGNAQYKENATETFSWLENTDEALGTLNSVLQRARELTVRSSNGSNADTDMKAIADELDQIIDEVGVIANTQIGDRYIFGGNNTKEEVYQKTGDVWRGNSKIMELEVGENIKSGLNIDGKKVFGVEADKSKSVFATLKKISKNVRNNNVDAINNEDLGLLDGHIDQVLSARSEVGARSNRIEMVQNRLDGANLSYTKVLSGNEDADMAGLIINLKEEESVYNAILSAGARIIQPTLLDYLR